MSRPASWLATLTVLCALLAPAAARAVVIGQVDDFEDGTTRDWVVGIAGVEPNAPPANVPTGGPRGAGDHYLLLTAVSREIFGNRLTVINQTQWTGDYLAAGIDAIAMDVRNLGATPLALRLQLSDPAPGSLVRGDNAAFSTVAVNVPAGGGWTRVAFPVDADSLTAGSGTVLDALANVTDLRIFHNPNPRFPGPRIDARLGVDNVTARPLGPPVADAGPPRTVHVGTTVQLDGSASSDPGGHLPLVFSWSLVVAPEGSGAALVDAVSARPSFVADKLGAYGAQLTVTNSRSLSDPSGRVDVLAVNVAPVARARRIRGTPRLGKRLTLKGGLSLDPDGDPLSYRWSFASRPRGSRARLRGAEASRASFVPDRRGLYVLRLVVSDPWASSRPALLRVRL